MSYARQHYEYAKDGTPTQDCDLELGPKVPKTDWGAGTDGASDRTPHREEKESDRE